MTKPYHPDNHIGWFPRVLLVLAGLFVAGWLLNENDQGPGCPMASETYCPSDL